MADVLTKEADARFWATGYRPGHKLDPSDPSDRAMMKAWMDIYAKVKAEDAAGQLHLTYNHPDVARDLSDASLASAAAAAHADATVDASDAATKDQHARASALAQEIAAAKTAAAASKQPPTASPAVLYAAATDAHAAAGLPPPAPPAFPSSHPVHTSSTALPAHEDLARPEQPVAVARPPTRPSDQLHLHQIATAPARAGAAHATARPVPPKIPPARLAAVRASASDRAQKRVDPQHHFVGVVQLPSGEEEDYVFVSYDDLMNWYEENLARGAADAYYAAFNADAPVWPEAIADGFGLEVVVVDPDLLPVPPMVPLEMVPAPAPRVPTPSPPLSSPAWKPPPAPTSLTSLTKTSPKGPSPFLLGGAAVALVAVVYLVASKTGGGSRIRGRIVP